ncbi:MAG: hypothetical protein ACC707_20755 [Thiohalomonadales bacterium]
MKYFLILAFLLTATLIHSVTVAAETKGKSDVRVGYFYADDTKPSKGISKQARLRFRYGYTTTFNKTTSLDYRMAARYYDDGSNERGTDYTSHTPYAADSIPAGQVTVDKFSVNYKPSKGLLIKIGRFQSKIELEGVAKKSLDRNDSPNTDINWTDGIEVSNKFANDLKLLAVIQYNHPDGSNVSRKPLSYEDKDARIGLFLALKNSKPSAPFVQQTVDFTYLPQSLCIDGVEKNDNHACKNANRENYMAAVGRLAMKWPVMDKSYFMFGGEIGYAPNVQKDSNGNDAADTAWMLSFSVVDFLPKQSLGFIIASAGAGWLISPDVAADNDMYAIRYAYKVSKTQKIEWRYRYRSTIDGADRTRKDGYLRYTQKFKF